MLNNVPLEMRVYPQWVAWRYEETDGSKPTKVPYSPLTGRHADVNDSTTWATFDQALHAVNSNNWYSGIGFVLTDNDPYTFIDLDDCEGNTIDEARQQQIYSEFNSFAERSPSGKGLHIIIKGRVPSGRRRSHIEIYSSQRYMTMTGDIFRNAPIEQFEDLANLLWSKLGEGKGTQIYYAGLESAKYPDEEILRLASTAANAEKFNDLFYIGNWQKYYVSQSEADFALIDILAFYSENRQQVQKLFLESKLGQREKSRAQYRINYCLDRCFDRMLPPVDIDGLRNQLVEIVENKQRESAQVAQETAPELPQFKHDVYSVPPGLVGEIAQFIYAQAPRPVAEIALVGAIGLVAGIVGRSYNISGTGLNQYVLLLAPTGTGKEAIAKGVGRLMTSVLKTVPSSGDFMGPGKISSEQALIKHLNDGKQSFVSLIGEFGIQLKLMSSAFASPHLQGLLAMLLDLYNKSGEGNVVRPSIYSDRAKNTASILAPAVTLIGESTPEKFYENLDESMISSGLLPRFTMIEYNGIRPELNEAHTYATPSFELIDKLGSLCANSLMLNGQNKVINVQEDADAREMFRKFNKHCDMNMNASDKEVRKHLWNRAHIKALKLGALIAVGCNPYNPVISEAVAHWAINVVTADVRNMLTKFESGEIGIDNEETKQLSKMIAVMADYVISPWHKIENYKCGTAQLHDSKIITYSFLHKRLSMIGCFKKDRMGSAFSIKRTIKTLIERGDIQELTRAELSTKFNTNAAAYMISNMKVFFPDEN